MLDNHGLTELHRGFRFGDGFFDTALVLKGRVVWAADHEKRMRFASDVLGLDLPWNDVHDWQMKASVLWNQNGQPEFGRLRTLVWRKWGEGYRPGGPTSEEQMEFEALNQCPVQDSSHPLRLGPSDLIKCPPRVPDIKSLSALPYLLAERYAQEKGWDDALVRTPQGGLLESSRSNLFYWFQGQCYTPSWASGCLPGIAALNLIQFLKAQGINVQEVNEPLVDLDRCSSIWLTNALRGVQRVSHWKDQVLIRQPEDDWVDTANRFMLTPTT
ncbi:MAG: aminotransferase class IV [Bacteroidia bacterium]